MKLHLTALLFSALIATSPGFTPDGYNVIWESPSTDHTGPMPLGNGDIAAGVYAIEDDALYLLLSKNDALTYNGDIFKTGRVKITLDPNPFTGGKPFQQTLDLQTGSILIEADGIGIRAWADANRNVYHVEITSPADISVTADSDLWNRIDGCRHNKSAEPTDPPTQDVRIEKDDSLIWYYAVGDRSVFPTEAEYYLVPEMTNSYPDPFRHNTFGNLMESPQLKLMKGQLKGSGKMFDIRIHAHCEQNPDIDTWITKLEKQAEQPVDLSRDWNAHTKWWKSFWYRSWITVTDNTLPKGKRGKLDHEGYKPRREALDKGALVAQNYNVFRYLMACQSRGRIQTKFNGGIFTQPLRYAKKPNMASTQVGDIWYSHEDDRLWARRFTFQNQRHLYWPMLMSGDTDMMKPFFDQYWNLLPIRTAITKNWFGHEGTYFRDNIELTGGERDCGGVTEPDSKPPKTPPGQNDGTTGYYHSYYFTSGLETVAMMIDYVHYTGDTDFRDSILVPFAREILLFFDKHYARDTDGKLKIDPGMVLETYWSAINATPDIAGLLHSLDELLAMGVGTEEDQKNRERFRKEIPEVHLHEIEGKRAIAPAESWIQDKKNAENGEFYAVFPFRRFGYALGDADLIQHTMEHRHKPNAYEYSCWTQDQIHWAMAGNAAAAQDGLIHRFSRSSRLCRFPIFGDERPDSCPDFDHFGSGSTALQRMLVQEGNGKIYLLPAWPESWDTSFKLHLMDGAVISGDVKNGTLTGWRIKPASRAADVIIPDDFKESPEQAAVREVMKRVADWQIVHIQDNSNTKYARDPLHHPLDWTHGALYVGMVKWADMANDPAYYAWLRDIGTRHNWGHIKRKYFADDHTVGQMYCDLSRYYSDPSMIEPTIRLFDDIIANPSPSGLEMGSKEWWNRWSWCDALFMAPPVLTRLTSITEDPKYLDWMMSEYEATHDYLFDDEENLYFRDSSYFDKRVNGKKVFWSRGNGWVFAGLTQMLDELPEDSQAYIRFMDIYKRMAARLLELQTADGHWSMSLLNAEQYPAPETSGTAFYCYGMAWGVNNGVLDETTYKPAVLKAWAKLTECVREDGLLGYVQPVGAAPGQSWPDITDVYGVGAFLAAGSEVYCLVDE